MADAKGKHLENQSNEAITQMMAQPPVLDSLAEGSYIPPDQQQPPTGAGL